MNFDLLGGVQPFEYFPDNCSIVMLKTVNVFRSRQDECLGKTYVYFTIASLFQFVLSFSFKHFLRASKC